MKEKNCPGVAPHVDDAVAAIDRSRARWRRRRAFPSAGSSGSDTRAILLASYSTRRRSSKRLRIRVFEREGLDDADALDRLLQGLENARAALELVARDAVDPSDHLAQDQERGRRHHKAKNDIIVLDVLEAEEAPLLSWPATVKPLYVRVIAMEITGRRFQFVPQPDRESTFA